LHWVQDAVATAFRENGVRYPVDDISLEH